MEDIVELLPRFKGIATPLDEFLDIRGGVELLPRFKGIATSSVKPRTLARKVELLPRFKGIATPLGFEGNPLRPG